MLDEPALITRICSYMRLNPLIRHMSEDRKSGKTATVPSMDLDTIRLAWRQADGAKPDVAAPDAPPAKFDAAQTVAAAPADHLRRSSHASERRTRSGTESRYLCEERRQSRPHHAETFSSSCVLISVRFQAGCRMVIAKSGFIRTVEYLSAHSHAHGRRRAWEVVDTHVRLAAFYWSLHRLRKKVERDPRPYIDPALIPLPAEPVKPRVTVEAAA